MCIKCFKFDNILEDPDYVELNYDTIKFQMPLFAQHITDNDDGIIGIILKPDLDNETIINADLIWKDEIHPCFCIDWIYRVYRHFKYGRTYDVQSIKYNYDNNLKIYNIYSSNWADEGSSWNICIAKHRCFKYQIDKFEKIYDTPIIYVSTWNHMYSLKQLDINLEFNKDKKPKIYCHREHYSYFI